MIRTNYATVLVRVLVPALVAALVASSCSKTEEKVTPMPSANTAASVSASASAGASAIASAAIGSATATTPTPPKTNLAWTDPPTWKKEPPVNTMRIAQYRIPKEAGDAEDAECTVSSFGPGGSVGENVDRWIRQFDPSTTKPFQKTERDVDGMHVTRLDIAGTYKGIMMQTAPNAKPKEGWRMTGAVVDTPGGLWFFKMTGPDKTAKAAIPAFDKMIDSLKK